MDSRRRFSASEKAALYLAADGHCEECGVELEPGWHADHVMPHSRHGVTDVINGQALCPPCNLKKGNAHVTDNLREWQQEAIEAFFARNSGDFLVCATPGAGKTTFALSLARRLLDDGAVERIMIVVPTDALRQQWADNAAEFGLDVLPVDAVVDYDKAGYHGCVATYHQIAVGAGADAARRATRRRTLAVLDEIHHAGDQKSWGNALQSAVELAVHRLSLTGTPWRRDGNPIPFVRYDNDGRVQVDYSYEYGAAVADGVCRRVEFHTYDGEARWVDHRRARREGRRRGSGQATFAARLGEEMDKDDVSMALDTVLDPRHAWIPDVLNEAVVTLEDLRTEVPDAAGLVIADTRWHAEEYALKLKWITGEMPVVVVSDPKEDPGSKAARKKIDDFRRGRDRWIVAVRMISEGVDIPRLAVGVYATKSSTPLFFRQVVGRFVRVRPNEEFNSRLLIPAVPELMQHAREIEDELRHQIDLEAEKESRAERSQSGSVQEEFDLRESLNASEATFDRTIFGGKDFHEDSLKWAKDYCVAHGIPIMYAAAVAPLFGQAGQAWSPSEESPRPKPPPRHRREKMLRGEVETLARKLAKLRKVAPKEVNSALYRKFGPRSKATVELLEEMAAFLWDELGKL